MKIKIFENAADQYRSICMTPDRAGSFRQEYFDKLKEIEGKEIEVETKYLFRDQFNVEGLRVMARSVEKVIDDKRIGRYFDRWTHKNHAEIPEECKHGERREYLFQWKENPSFPVIPIEEKVFQD